MSEAEVEERLKRREIDRRSYAWREGMPEWLRLESIENFQALASEVGDASWRIVTPIEATYPESGAPEKPNDEPRPQETEAPLVHPPEATLNRRLRIHQPLLRPRPLIPKSRSLPVSWLMVETQRSQWTAIN